jgi:DNA-directed RNA polymerase specialized sigma54-like protein
MDETEMKVRKLNRNETLHFENYASLPASIRGDIKMKLADAKGNGDADAEALIHTGVVSIEAAIRQYVQKYAKTAKIKNIVDTFMHKLDEVGCFEKTKQELAKNRANAVAEFIKAQGKAKVKSVTVDNKLGSRVAIVK